MASNGYPKITAKAWRTLRTRAANAPSTKFTPATVAAIMGMSTPESARDNTVNPMRRVGLIDDDGALTPRGNKWRIDSTYAEACQEIIDEVYQGDLDAFVDADGKPDPQQVRTWFDHKGFGGSNAAQMAATYVMVASKEPPEPMTAPVATGSKSTPKKQAAKAAAKPANPKAAETPAVVKQTPPPSPEQVDSRGPNIHLDIQIHIPADASLEQIDKIFESMSKHLYGK
jgi:hypothetical protein